MTRIPTPTESSEQIAYFSWLDTIGLARWPWMNVNGRFAAFAIPNGGARNAVTGARLKREGVRAGVPDVCVPYYINGGFVISLTGVARKGMSGLFLEFKRVRGGQVRANQKAWHVFLRNQGYHVVVVRGYDEAIEVTEKYMEGRI